jgi:hypothetical protein
VLTPLLAVPILNVVGFTAVGPAAGKERFLIRDSVNFSNTISIFFSFSRMSGTLAAGIQAWMGNVVAGGLFAAAQGAAMGAGIPVVFQVVSEVVTGVVTGIVGAIVTVAAH